ncbi:MAG: hypothetical protein HYW27_03515, partial [Candidatus Aenigmarchaeota archaeon]|nr:hypothetical protein [Candidatus Aenigmarchaeota archaeon]
IDILGTSKNQRKRRNISFTEKAILWEKNKSHICHICRQRIHSLTEAEVDHIRAHLKGGQGVNWAHRACNRLKGKKSLSEIHRRLGIKTKKRKYTRKKSKDNYWINPITGRKEKIKPLFGL